MHTIELQTQERRDIRKVIAAALGAVTLLAACGGSATKSASRPEGLRYVTLSNCHPDPNNLQLSESGGAVAVAGDPNAGKKQSSWNKAAVLRVSKQALKGTLRSGDAVVLDFTDPSGNVRDCTLPPDAVDHLGDVDPELDEMAAMVGPGATKFQLGVADQTGKVTLLPTALVDREELDKVAKEYPGIVTAASPS